MTAASASPYAQAPPRDDLCLTCKEAGQKQERSDAPIKKGAQDDREHALRQAVDKHNDGDGNTAHCLKILIPSHDGEP